MSDVAVQGVPDLRRYPVTLGVLAMVVGPILVAAASFAAVTWSRIDRIEDRLTRVEAELTNVRVEMARLSEQVAQQNRLLTQVLERLERDRPGP